MNTTLSNKDLLTQCQPYPQQANFELLYQRYRQTVFKQCLSVTKDYHLAQDYTQDIFLKAFINLPSFKFQAKFSTWLKAITRNYCIDQKRLTAKLPVTVLDEVKLGIWPQEETGYLQEARLSILNEAMSSLSDMDQSLLRLKYQHNYSLEQLSLQYNLTLSCVKMRLLRGKKSVRQWYRHSRD